MIARIDSILWNGNGPFNSQGLQTLLTEAGK